MSFKSYIAPALPVQISKRDRINELKSLKKLANIYLTYYKEFAKQKANKWQNKKAIIAIQELKKIINRIHADQHTKKIESYCAPMPDITPQMVGEFMQNSENPQNIALNEYFSAKFSQVQGGFVLFEIARLAPEANIVHDIVWLNEGTIGEIIQIGLGNQDVSILEAYLPNQIQKVVSAVLPFYENKIGYKDRVDVIKQALSLSQDQQYLTSNILLITVTESIVRDLCFFLYIKQNSCSEKVAEKYVYHTFNSLDTLLSKGDWKNDYPINLNEAITIYKDVDDDNVNEWKNRVERHKIANGKIRIVSTNFSEQLKKVSHLTVLSDEDERAIKQMGLNYVNELGKLIEDLLPERGGTVGLSIKIILHFLIRKYKDDRNFILHGKFDTFNHKWKNYVNFAALVRVYETHRMYEEFYANQPTLNV